MGDCHSWKVGDRHFRNQHPAPASCCFELAESPPLSPTLRFIHKFHHPCGSPAVCQALSQPLASAQAREDSIGSGCPLQRAWPRGQFFPAYALFLVFLEGESEDVCFFLRSEQSSGRLSTQEAGCLTSQLWVQL